MFHWYLEKPGSMMMIDAPIALNNNSVVLVDPTTLPLVFVAIVLFMISKIGNDVAEVLAVNKSVTVDADLAALDHEKTNRLSEDGSSSPAVELIEDIN